MTPAQDHQDRDSRPKHAPAGTETFELGGRGWRAQWDPFAGEFGSDGAQQLVHYTELDVEGAPTISVGIQGRDIDKDALRTGLARHAKRILRLLEGEVASFILARRAMLQVDPPPAKLLQQATVLLGRHAPSAGDFQKTADYLTALYVVMTSVFGRNDLDPPVDNVGK